MGTSSVSIAVSNFIQTLAVPDPSGNAFTTVSSSIVSGTAPSSNPQNGAPTPTMSTTAPNPAPKNPTDPSNNGLPTPTTSTTVLSSAQANPTASSNDGPPTSRTSSKSASLLTTTAPRNSTSQASMGSDRLSDGAVAGVVIAVALGLAFLTFLVTFFMMRRKKTSQKQRQTPVHEKPGYLDADRKGPPVTAGLPAGDSLINSLPQSADDATIQRSVEETLEQIRLHIENFYQNTPTSTSRDELEESDLKSFDSSYLPAPLAVMLSQSTKATPILKHTLSNLVTTSVSPTGSPAQSLLPAEFVLLPSKTRLSKSSTSKKPGQSIIVPM